MQSKIKTPQEYDLIGKLAAKMTAREWITFYEKQF